MWSKKTKSTAKKQFADCISTLFNQPSGEKVDETADKQSLPKPNILFSFYFSHVDSNSRLEKHLNTDALIPNNIHLIGGSNTEIDYDFHVSRVINISNTNLLLIMCACNLVNHFIYLIDVRLRKYSKSCVRTSLSCQSRQSWKTLFSTKKAKKVRTKKPRRRTTTTLILQYHTMCQRTTKTTTNG